MRGLFTRAPVTCVPLLRLYEDSSVSFDHRFDDRPADAFEWQGRRWNLEQLAHAASSSAPARCRFRLTLLQGPAVACAFGARITLGAWHSEVFSLLPAAIYAGNRFVVCPQPYSPRYPAALRGPHAPIAITDLPRLAVTAGEPSQFRLFTRDLAAPQFACHWPDRSLAFLLHAAGLPQDALWEFVENGDRTEAQLSLLLRGLRHERYSFFEQHIRSDFPAEERPQPLNPGESLEIDLALEEHAGAGRTDLFERLYSLNWAGAPASAARCEIPISAASDLVEAKRNREDWEDRLQLYRTTNLAPEQTRNIFQTGWCGGIIAESALLAGQEEISRARAAASLATIVRGARYPSGFLAAKCHADGSWTADLPRPNQHPHTARWSLVRRQADALWYLQVAQKRWQRLTGTVAPAEWTETVRQLASALVRLWQREKQLGHFIDAEQAQIEIGGSCSGALAPAGLCTAARQLNAPELRSAASEMGLHFWMQFTSRGLTVGGPGDALQAPDSESAAALIETYLALHESDAPDGPWLERAAAAAAQFASWVTPHDFAFPPASEFGRLQMPSRGSVWANVQNKHAAPGICTHSGLSLLRLFRHTGDLRHLHLLEAIARMLPWCVSREDRPIHAADGRILPAGWINERVNLSDWDHNIGGVFHGSTWSEVALLLTAMELPAIYAQSDTRVLATLDHLTAAWADDTGDAILVRNPTAFPARVRCLVETSDTAVTTPLDAVSVQSLPVLHLAPGAEAIWRGTWPPVAS